MISAAIKALGDLFSAELRSVVLKSVGLTLLLFVGLFLAVQSVFWFLTLVPWPWLETLIAIGAGLGLLVVFFFLMAPVTAMFAGLYLDHVADKVEARHYPLAIGKPMSVWAAVVTGLQFGLLVLVINILALPLVFTGVGALILLTINAYLLSRQYFEMAAMRMMSVDDAKALRSGNAANIFIAGFLPAVMTLIPFVNLLVPLYATSYFIHLFRQVRTSSA